jgi:hypothetical protein
MKPTSRGPRPKAEQKSLNRKRAYRFFENIALKQKDSAMPMGPKRTALQGSAAVDIDRGDTSHSTQDGRYPLRID